MLSGTLLKMSHPSHFIHCIVAIILVVCIIPYVDPSMCVSALSSLLPYNKTTLPALSPSPRALVRTMRQSLHTSKFIVLGIEMAIHHEGQNCIVHWPRTSGLVYL